MEVGTEISLRGLKGVVRYVGEYHVKPGTWVGIELEQPRGKNNGVIAGKQYFECEDKHGLFLSLEDALKFCKVGPTMSKSQSQGVAAPDQKPKSVAHSPSAEPVPQPSSPRGSASTRQRATSQSETDQKPSSASKTAANLGIPALKGLAAAQAATLSPRETEQSPRSAKSPPSARGEQRKPASARGTMAPPGKIAETKSVGLMPTLKKAEALSPKVCMSDDGGRDPPQPASARVAGSRRSAAQVTPPKKTVITTPPPGKKEETQTTPNAQESPSKHGQLPEAKSVERMPTLKKTVIVPPSMTSDDGRSFKGDSSDSSMKGGSSGSQTLLGRTLATRPRAATEDESASSPRRLSNDESVKKPSESRPAVKRMPVAGRRNTSEDIRVTLAQPPEAGDLSPRTKRTTILSPRRSADESPTSPRRMSNPDAASPGKQAAAPRRHSTDDSSPSVTPPPETDSKLVPPKELTPEQQKIKDETKEMQKKCTLYQQKLDTLREKKEKLAGELRSKKSEFDSEIESQKQKFEQEMLQMTLDRETELLALEEELLAETEAQKRQLTSPDSAKAAEKIDMLAEIDEEHRRYQEEFMKFIEAQRINRNTVNQTILTLTKRLEKVQQYRHQKEKELADLKAQAAKMEKELEAKRPQWKSITELRAQQEQISGKLGSVTSALRQRIQESDGMREFYGVFGIPFIECMVAFDRIREKLKCTTFTPVQKAEVLHICDLGDFVFTYFLNMSFTSQDLMVELENVEEQLERNAFPAVAILYTSLQKVSKVPLEDALTAHLVEISRMRTSDEAVSAKIAQFQSLLKRTLHPKLMTKDAAGFTGWLGDLRAELKKAEKGETCDIGLFAETTEMFMKDAVPEVSRMDGFFALVREHRIEEQVDDLTPKWQQEKNDLRDQLDILTPELSDKRKEYEQLKSIVSSA